MISRAEALERARSWAAGDRPDAAPEVGLYEFDGGYVAWVVEPAPDPAAGPPAATGSPRIVVDGETGELSQWPSLPAPEIAARYADRQAAAGRFPPDVRYVLEQAGWFPGRDVTAAVEQWRRECAEDLAGFDYSPAARAALTEFGGLVLPQFGRKGQPGGGFTSYVYPQRAGVVTMGAEGFIEEFDHPVHPLGTNDDGPSELVIDAQGRVFLLHWVDMFFVAPDLDTALVRMIRGGEFPSADERTW
ncbi:SUKH-3 domain-containing protein [Plantactinospora siamensis]|uniref:SUKH-3 domain-containing protein n=1 Tax=Plantactinospora siamensis TaxID=555372 RepID=A0ABV6NQ35_9ACTN